MSAEDIALLHSNTQQKHPPTPFCLNHSTDSSAGHRVFTQELPRPTGHVWSLVRVPAARTTQGMVFYKGRRKESRRFHRNSGENHRERLRCAQTFQLAERVSSGMCFDAVGCPGEGYEQRVWFPHLMDGRTSHTFLLVSKKG